jgi:hypothetical protein
MRHALSDEISLALGVTFWWIAIRKRGQISVKQAIWPPEIVMRL